MSRRSAPYLASLAAALVAVVLHLNGALVPLDHLLLDLRYRLLQRPASQSLVVVQIDARSLRELDRWPWPRGFHADLLDRLFAAGASEVALDVDLSARSEPDQDALLIAALERAGNRVILPGFRQRASPEAAGGAVFATLPQAYFLRDAQIGSANISPAPDGLIRRAEDTPGRGEHRVPSTFALLIGPSAVRGDSFLIDYGIDPRTIPRLSYVDVLRDRFPAEAVAGHKVIVGATAAELGDTFAVPVYRSLPGSLVQAMAYESLYQGRALHAGGPLTVTVACLLIAMLALAVFARTSWRTAVATGVGTLIGIEGAAIAVQATWPIALPTGAMLLTVVLCFLIAMSGRVERQAREILSQRQAIATRRALMDQTVENSFDGILIADERGGVELCNASAAQILDRTVEEVVAGAVHDVLPVAIDEHGRVIDLRTETPLVPNGLSAETTVSRRAGPPLAVELVLGRVELPAAHRGRQSATGTARAETYFTFTFRDISERQRVREAEKRASEEAVAANRAKTEFLANMSHELRTPLNAIIGFADVMRAGTFGPLEPPRYGQYVEDIAASGKHLLGIINDILDVSRIELGEFRLHEEDVNVAAILRACIHIAEGWPHFATRRFQAEIAEPLPTVRGDERVLKQTVLNLLSNAFKYSRDGDEIILSAVERDDRHLEIAVRDSGIGIAAEDLAKITRPFFQVDGSLARKEEGAGLGLALCQQFVTLHRGTLDIESTPGAGTRVTVRLPLRGTREVPAEAVG